MSLLPQDPGSSTPQVLQVGHVIEVRGELEGPERFLADRVELQSPDADQVLIGEVPADQSDPDSFLLLGQPVVTEEETVWNPERASLAGKRVKVEGSWKGPRKFRASSITPRGAGRDRIGGRIDELRRVEGGWEARVMVFTVLLRDDTVVEHELPVDQYALSEARKIGSDSKDIERDEDDVFGRGIALSDTLRLMGQLESTLTMERDFDLDRDQDRDRRDLDLPVRLRFAWSPSERIRGQLEVRFTERVRHEETSTGDERILDHSGNFGETWLQLRDIGGHEGFDATLGRQDFDDPREWIYDQNLDALRLSWIQPTWRLDVAAATLLTDGSERDQESNNAIAYLSNNDSDRHLALWTVYRDIGSFGTGSDLVPDETSLHVGLRAMGDWLPDTTLWADFAYQLASRPLFAATNPQGTQFAPTGEDASVSAWAYDIGTTWSPAFADPLYFTAAYALGRGDGDDGTFRQTGFQDNTDRWGGVTSFRYYGELFDPELSNLGILTLGVGARVAERTSLDFVFHTYTQDKARAEFSPLPQRDADIKPHPNGRDADLGWEADLILGYRRYKSWDLEIVGATFDPSTGFDLSDPAYLLKVQLRYRF